MDDLYFKNRDYTLSDWQYEKLVEQIKEFQDSLDSEHEIAVSLANFGQNKMMVVEDLGYQNPCLIYFFGYINGNRSQLIQHLSQINFILKAVKKEPNRPAFRIGFSTIPEV